jgi:hypothetical protein
VRGPPPVTELLHPAALAAIVLLFVNDHVLKGRAPGWITGKLSDLAGLLFFPLLLTSAWNTLFWALGREDCELSTKKLGVALAATAVGFVAWKLGGVLGAVRDPTDLVALVMLAPAWWIGRSTIRRRAMSRG